MYEPHETEISKAVLLEILTRLKLDENFGLIGGWAIYLTVNKNFLGATGKDYLQSRDIDLFVNCNPGFLKRLKSVMQEIGFVAGEYMFRYELIVDRDTMKPLPESEARKKPIFELFYVFLDLFGNKKNEMLGVWVNEWVGEMTQKKAFDVKSINGRQVFVPKPEFLLSLKVRSFTQRMETEKGLKDACDIYALLFYSSPGISEKIKDQEIGAAIKTMCRDDIAEFIAQTLFGDRLKYNLIIRNLLQVIERI